MKYVIMTFAAITMALVFVCHHNNYMDKDDMKMAVGLLLFIMIGFLAYNKIKDSL